MRTGTIENALPRGDLGDRPVDCLRPPHEGGPQALLAERLQCTIDADGLPPHLFWGIPLLVGGSAFLLGLFANNKVGFWLRIAGIVVGALAAGSLYAFFTVTSAANPRVGTTAPPTYLFVAGFQLAMLYGAVFTRRIEPTIRTTKG